MHNQRQKNIPVHKSYFITKSYRRSNFLFFSSPAIFHIQRDTLFLSKEKKKKGDTRKNSRWRKNGTKRKVFEALIPKTRRMLIGKSSAVKEPVSSSSRTQTSRLRLHRHLRLPAVSWARFRTTCLFFHFLSIRKIKQGLALARGRVLEDWLREKMKQPNNLSEEHTLKINSLIAHLIGHRRVSVTVGGAFSLNVLMSCLRKVTNQTADQDLCHFFFLFSFLWLTV